MGDRIIELYKSLYESTHKRRVEEKKRHIRRPKKRSKRKIHRTESHSTVISEQDDEPKGFYFTYQTVTPESIEYGDFADNGYLGGDIAYGGIVRQGTFDPDIIIKTNYIAQYLDEEMSDAEVIAEYLDNTGLVFEPSSTGPWREGNWLSGINELHMYDYSCIDDNEIMTVDLHFSGYSQEEQAEIVNELKKTGIVL